MSKKVVGKYILKQKFEIEVIFFFSFSEDIFCCNSQTMSIGVCLVLKN